MKVDVSDDALTEWLEGTAWYAEQEPDTDLSRRFYDAVDDALARLPTRRLRKLHGVDLPMPHYVVDVGRPWPYRLIFFVDGDVRRVVSIAHYSRRPGHWLGAQRISEK